MSLKFVRVGIAALVLAFAGCALAQDKTVGYDIGACSPEEFVGAHVEIGKDVAVISVAPGPERVVKLEEPIVYKFVSADKDGKHYVQENGLELVIIKQDDKAIVGKIVDDGKTVAVVFGVPGDGSKLSDNAKAEYETCKDIRSKVEKPESNIDPLDGVSRT
jgi:hypothetical protein